MELLKIVSAPPELTSDLLYRWMVHSGAWCCLHTAGPLVLISYPFFARGRKGSNAAPAAATQAPSRLLLCLCIELLALQQAAFTQQAGFIPAGSFHGAGHFMLHSKQLVGPARHSQLPFARRMKKR